MKKISNSPFTIFILLSKELYEIVLIFLPNLKIPTTMDLNFDIFDFIIKVVTITILYFVLKSLKKSNDELERSKLNYISFINVLQFVNRVRSFNQYTNNLRINEDALIVFTNNLKQEQKSVFEMIQNENPNLDKNSILENMKLIYGNELLIS